MADIKILKLLTGEEIMGVILVPSFNIDIGKESLGDDSSSVFIQSPMRIIYEYDRDGKQTIYLYDWMGSCSESCYIVQKHHIITSGTPSPVVLELYTQLALKRLSAGSGEPLEDQIEAREALTMKKMLEDIKFDDEDMN